MLFLKNFYTRKVLTSSFSHSVTLIYFDLTQYSRLNKVDYYTLLEELIPPENF